MNRKGFTLIEFLGCMALLGVILCIGLFVTRDTLSTALSTLTDVSISQIYTATDTYIIENQTSWINDGEEYTCIKIKELVDAGYFDSDEVINYQDECVKVVRDAKTKVTKSMSLMDDCN